MAIDRVDLPTVTAMLEDNPALAKVRYYTQDSPQTGATFLTRNMDPWVQWTPEIRADNLAIARLLIENGSDIEGFGGYAWSSGGRPLHIAANHDNARVARLLLEAGADANALARDRPPLQWSVGQGVRVADTAAVLMDGGAEYNLLHLVHFKLLGRLAEEMGDRINNLFPVRDAEPTSLLHIAAVRNDFPDVVQWLLERGADPALVDANGMTPKQVAVAANRSDAVRALLGLERAENPEPARDAQRARRRRAAMERWRRIEPISGDSPKGVISMTDIAIDTVELEPQPALVVRRKVAIADLGEALADIRPRVFQHIAAAGPSTGLETSRSTSCRGAERSRPCTSAPTKTWARSGAK